MNTTKSPIVEYKFLILAVEFCIEDFFNSNIPSRVDKYTLEIGSREDKKFDVETQEWLKIQATERDNILFDNQTKSVLAANLAKSDN